MIDDGNMAAPADRVEHRQERTTEHFTRPIRGSIMWKTAFVVLIASTAALSQTPPEPQRRTGSLSGVVRDASTGAPLADVSVSVAGENATSDAQGQFSFEKMAPGSQWLAASAKSHGAYGGRYVLVSPGQETRTVVDLELGGVVSGRVLDDDEQPVAGVTVLLLRRKYEYGALVYAPDRAVATGRDGEYRLEGIPTGRSFLILAKKPLRATDAKGRVLRPSLYPNARDIQGAQSLKLTAGEIRTRVDITMSAARSYCIAGLVDRMNDPKTASVVITERLSFASGWKLAPAMVNTGRNGQFHTCGLPPGEYHVEVPRARNDVTYAMNDITITDDEVNYVKLLSRFSPTISGEITFDPAPRGESSDIQLALMSFALGGNGYVDSTENPALFGYAVGGSRTQRVPAPGSFTIGSVGPEDLQLSLPNLRQDCYLKEASYGNQNVLHAPLRLAQAMEGARLHLVIGCDGGTLTARVTDKDGNPVSYVIMYLIAADATSEGALAVSLRRSEVVSGWSTPLTGVRPGKYLALATDVDLNPRDAPADKIEMLWRARSNAKEVEIGPGAIVQIELEPLHID